MNKIDSIISILENDWSNDDLVQAWNEFCGRRGYSDNEIYYMGSFNEMFNGSTPMEIAEMLLNRDFRTDDDYFAFNAYGNIISFNDVNDYNSFSFTELADYLVEWGDSGLKEVDSDALEESFLDYYFDIYMHDEVMMNLIKQHIEAEGYDFLMDNWDDIVDDIEDMIASL